MTRTASLRSLEHEQQPICSAILIAKNAENLSAHGECLVETVGRVTLASGGELTSLAQLVNGLAGAIVATPDGIVRGAVMYLTRKGATDVLLPPRYRGIALASQTENTLCFVFLGSGRIQVFHQGKRILSYRNAAWHLQLENFNRGLSALAKQHTIASGVLAAVLRVALLLADNGKGTLLTVGDHEGVLALSDPPKTAHLRFPSLLIGAGQSDAMLMGALAQDGATIIAADGRVIQPMTFLRPPVGTEAEEEVGRGSKHSTAAKISKATKCIAVAVSVDGRVTIYGMGTVRLKVMG